MSKKRVASVVPPKRQLILTGASWMLIVLTFVFQGLRTAARDEGTPAAPPRRPGKGKQLVHV
jgi:hypothetical protein